MRIDCINLSELECDLSLLIIELLIWLVNILSTASSLHNVHV